jgi:protein TonB
MVTFFDLAAPPPPEPVAEPEPEQKPAVPEPAKKIPLPPPTNAPPKAVKQEPKKEALKVVAKKPEEKKTVVTNTPPKPKTLEERLAEVRKGGKPVKPSTRPRPQLDFSGIKSALNSAASAGSSSGTGSGSGGVYSPFAGYYDSIKRQMYAVWQQPAGVPISLTATATIRVERDGTVSLKSITRRSGNVSFDQSVQSALDSTVRLPAPPADLPDRTISIEFLLAD